MNIAKLILLACPTFLASMLLVANPAHAFIVESAPVTKMILVASAQPTLELTAPNLIHASNPIIDQLGCSCATCVKPQFQMLQGKLPATEF
ncbi:hypothetical protein VB711_10265 [Cronbergia sp. UHCC 0137]|uniref:hypothetical protein n=1 Tax=Cronbergia sp. UHCC 0137 TaxID=3110239 RepID=UPI002B213AF5|nr:hypothetical protein [Cronbergia sp. UHCC 0137]MEA5618215.1 hypothetical protein [Cronbergia sp. UHCC 0137]